MQTAWPYRLRSSAAASPAGPPPTMPTLIPVSFIVTGSGCLETFLSQSARNLWTIPRATARGGPQKCVGLPYPMVCGWQVSACSRFAHSPDVQLKGADVHADRVATVDAPAGLSHRLLLGVG